MKKFLAIKKCAYEGEILTIFPPIFLYLQSWALCVYVLCVMDDLIKPLHIHQMDLGSVKYGQHRGAPTASPRFIYMQQYTEPQPTPKHTYTNHSRHVKLNLNLRAHLCTSGWVQIPMFVCRAEGRGEATPPQKKDVLCFSRAPRRLGDFGSQPNKL